MRLTMRLGTRSYDIIIKRGALTHVGELCNLNRKVLIVTDDGVPAQYAETLAAQCACPVLAVVPQGEGSKSIAQYERLLGIMLEHDFGRGDAVAAMGGGVVGDLAGFVAASYMRGVEFFNCPTTTLAQIDSSIGGKVALNLDGTKNIIGAFYQPRLVVADPDTLQTLSARHINAGLAEAVKAGLIGDAGLFELFEQAQDREAVLAQIETILYRSLAVKKDVVEQDECEQGRRAVLNFGHTIGHGIESAAQLGGLYHGECVALGMLPMVQTAALRDRLRAVCQKLALPTELQYSGDEIFSYMQHDKKANNGVVTVVKVQQAGEAYLEKMPMDLLRRLVGEGVV